MSAPRQGGEAKARKKNGERLQGAGDWELGNAEAKRQKGIKVGRD